MINVLNNAVKYTTTGTVTLSVSFTPIDNSDMDGASNIPNNLHKDINLIISIADTGVGIREKDMDKLFGKFERLDPSKNRTVEGSGLGLAIVHNLLELMNGDIAVQSVYGEGSTFTITLPQAVVADEIIGNLENKLEKSNLEVAKYKESFRAPEAKILVVDDTPVNMVVVKNLLKKTEIQIDVAESGKECLEKSGISKYDLIFLDYRMPEMDGIETLKRLKNLKDNPNKTTPVIALTANALSGAREHFIKEGFDNYMTKPINADSLESTLLKYLPADKIIN
jgi:CheY-like chemotaxis protein